MSPRLAPQRGHLVQAARLVQMITPKKTSPRSVGTVLAEETLGNTTIITTNAPTTQMHPIMRIHIARPSTYSLIVIVAYPNASEPLRRPHDAASRVSVYF